MYVRHLQLGSFRSWERVDLALGPGPDGVRRPQRRGQDQPGRGGRLPGHDGQPPGLLRRPAGAARRRAGGGPGGAAPGRPRAAGRDRDQPGPGQPGAGQPGAAAAAARAARRGPHGAVRARGPRPGARRPDRAPAVPRRAAGHPHARGWPACAPTTTGCSSSATPCSRPRGWPAARRSRPSTSGTATSPTSAASCSPPGCSWSPTSPRTWRGSYAEVAGDGRRRRRRSATPRPCRWPGDGAALEPGRDAADGGRADRGDARAGGRAAQRRARPRA